MTPNSARASLRKQLAQHGSDVTLKRQTAVSPQTFNSVTVRARVVDFRPEQLIGGIIQGDRKVIMSNEEIAAASWPGPPRKGDKVVVASATYAVEGCNTFRLDGTIVRHELLIRG